MKSTRLARITAIAASLATLAALATIPGSSSQAVSPGFRDTSFGNRGLTLTGFSPKPEPTRVIEMVADADGSAVVLSVDRSNIGFALTRVSPSGAVEGTFGEQGTVTGGFTISGSRLFPFAIALQSDGSTVIGGSSGIFTTGGLIVRYDRNGEPDRGFGEGGTLVTEAGPLGMAVDGADRIVAAATTDSNEITVSRYLPDGSPDRSFGTNGSVVLASAIPGWIVHGISLAAGRITVGGQAGAARLLPDGRLDTGFGDGGFSTVRMFSFAVDQLGRIVYSPDSTIYRRLLADGSQDTSFGNGGTLSVATQAQVAVEVDSTGRAVFGGSSIRIPDTWNGDFELMRLLDDGQLDPGFAGDGIATHDFGSGGPDGVIELAARPDGTILAAGNARQGTSTVDQTVVAQYLENGDLDPSYGGGDGFVLVDPLMAPNDRILDAVALSGGIAAVGATQQFAAIAAYGPDGRLDAGFGGDGRVEDRLSSVDSEEAQAVARVAGGGLAVCSVSSAGARLVRYGPSGTPDGSFGEGGSVPIPELRRCGSVLQDRSGRLVVAGVDIDNRVGLIRLNSFGGRDRSFGSEGYVLGPQFSLAGGGYRDVDMDFAPNGDLVVAGDRFRATVARFTPDGRERRSFGEGGRVRLEPQADMPVLSRATSVDVDTRGRILVGGGYAGGIGIVALTADGKSIRSFGEQGIFSRKIRQISAVEDLKVNRGGSIVAAGWSSERCLVPRFYCLPSAEVIRLRRSGDPDPGFGKNGRLPLRIGASSKAMAVTTSRAGITVAGMSESTTQRRQFMLVRLKRP